MKLRTSLLAAGVAVAAMTVPSSAAPLCNQVTDAAGDTFLARNQDTNGGPYGPQEDGMDIVSADVASDGKSITTVIRIKNLGATVGTAPGGIGFDFNFVGANSENTLFLRATKTSSGETFEAGYKEALPIGVTTLTTLIGPVTGVIDVPKNEVRVTAPLSTFDGQGGLKAGEKITLGEVTTGRTAGPRSVFADVAVPEKSYKIGDATCVVVGK